MTGTELRGWIVLLLLVGVYWLGWWARGRRDAFTRAEDDAYIRAHHEGTARGLPSARAFRELHGRSVEEPDPSLSKRGRRDA